MRLKFKTWRRLHKLLAVPIVSGGAAHALLIEGTMEFWSKLVLCSLVLIATIGVLFTPSSLAMRRRYDPP